MPLTSAALLLNLTDTGLVLTDMGFPWPDGARQGSASAVEVVDFRQFPASQRLGGASRVLFRLDGVADDPAEAPTDLAQGQKVSAIALKMAVAPADDVNGVED
jgi:hypothetical protein